MSAHAAAGWAALAIVVAVAIAVAVSGFALMARIRRLRKRFDHPMLRRLAATAVDVRRLHEARTQFEALAARAKAALEQLQAAGVERARLRREASEAVSSILSNLREIGDLLN